MSRLERFRMTMLLATVFVSMLAAGCATRPLSSARKGLLDHVSSRGDEIAIATQAGPAAEDEAAAAYAPKDGDKIQLTGVWQWPLKNVSVSSGYGDRGSKFHQGIDLHAPYGTPVLAAADGDVVYVGSKIRGYGRMVVIKHKDNFYSVYAHHSRNAVKVGRHVRRGQVIAYSGKSGHATGPHLHFEIRKGTQSFDPEYALNTNIREFASSTERKVAGSAAKD